jgi:hypothetical protein
MSPQNQPGLAPRDASDTCTRGPPRGKSALPTGLEGPGIASFASRIPPTPADSFLVRVRSEVVNADGNALRAEVAPGEQEAPKPTDSGRCQRARASARPSRPSHHPSKSPSPALPTNSRPRNPPSHSPHAILRLACFSWEQPVVPPLRLRRAKHAVRTQSQYRTLQRKPRNATRPDTAPPYLRLYFFIL